MNWSGYLTRCTNTGLKPFSGVQHCIIWLFAAFGQLSQSCLPLLPAWQVLGMARSPGRRAGKPFQWETWQSCGNLTGRWEIVLETNGGKMVQWVSDELINKPTMAGIALNCCALTHLANWWCKRQTSPKSPSVLELEERGTPKEHHRMCFAIVFIP